MKKTKQIIQTPEHIKVEYRTLAANLVGEEDRTKSLQMELDFHAVPEDMPFEQAVFDVIGWHLDNDWKPTPHNILTTLQSRGIEDAKALFENVMKCQTEDAVLEIHLRKIQEHQTNQRNKEVWDKATALLDSPVGTEQERAEKAVAMVMDILPPSEDEKVMGDRDRFEDWKKRQRERYELARLGLTLGPRMPFDGFHKLVPTLFPGQVTLLSAKQKTGKSILSWMIAEHNAWLMGKEVLLFHFEDHHDILEQRQMSRRCKIPLTAMSGGYLNPDDPRIQPALQEFQTTIDEAAGEIHSVFCPEWNVKKVRTLIRLHSRRAKSMGKELVVVLDYLDKIEPDQDTGNESYNIGKIVNGLKNEAEKTQCHIFLFSQETPNGNGDDEPHAFGSRRPGQKVQCYVSFKRFDEAATQDYPVLEYDEQTKQKVHAVDALGHPRYYHRQNQRVSYGEMRVVYANNGQPGKFKLLFDTTYFNIVEVQG